MKETLAKISVVKNNLHIVIKKLELIRECYIRNKNLVEKFIRFDNDTYDFLRKRQKK